MKELARSLTDAMAFFRQFKPVFTTTLGGRSWPNHEGTWRNATTYFRGLLRPGGNTVTDIADTLDTEPEPLERFVRESPWNHTHVEGHLHARVPEQVEGEDAVLVVDSMPIPKRGTRTVGAARQWCSVLGKIANCQVTVNTVIARPGAHDNTDQVTWPLSMRLYLTKKWAGHETADYDTPEERRRYADLREATHIPDEVEYRPKYAIALEQIERAVAAGIRHDCVVADTEFGRPRAFRAGLRDLGEPYALEVEPTKCNVVPEATILLEPGDGDDDGRRTHPAYPEDVDAKTPAAIAEAVEREDGWITVAWNEGSKGTMCGEFYRTRVRVVEHATKRWVTDETGWLLLKKNHGITDEDEDEAGDDDDDDDEDVEVGGLKAWVCWGLDGRSLGELVDRSQVRFAVERFHQDTKGELGAGEYQGRTWTGFHHHLSAVMLGHAFVAEQRLARGVGRADLPSFQQVVRDVVKEHATQALMVEFGFDRARAEEIGVYMLRGFSGWKHI